MKAIIEPIITEKSMNQAREGKYTFIVSKNADKKTIKRVAEKMFKIKVVSISTFVVKGKSTRSGLKRIEVKNRPIKRAVIIVQKGQTIPLFEATQ